MRRLISLLFVCILCSQTQAEPPPEKPTNDFLPEGAIAWLGSPDGRRGENWACMLSTDGKTLLAEGWCGGFRRFDAKTLKLLERVDLPLASTHEIRPSVNFWRDCSCVSADTRVALVRETVRHLGGQGGDDAVYEAWDLNERKCVARLPMPPKHDIWHTAISADGKIAAIMYFNSRDESRGQTIVIWDIPTGKTLPIQLTRAMGVEQLVEACGFAPDGKRMVASVDGKKTFCWDTENGKLLWKAAGSSEHFEFTLDGKYVFEPCLRENKKVWPCWELATGKPMDKFEFPSVPVEDFPIVCDGRTLLLPNWGRTANLRAAFKSGSPAIEYYCFVDSWDLREGKSLGRKRIGYSPDVRNGERCSCLLWPDGKTITITGDGMRNWNVADGKPVSADPNETGHTAKIDKLVFSPDGKTLASAAHRGNFLLWDVQQHKLVARVDKRFAEYPFATALRFTPDSKQLAISAGQSYVDFVSSNDGKPVRRVMLATREKVSGDDFLEGTTTLAARRFEGNDNSREIFEDYWSLADGTRRHSLDVTKAEAIWFYSPSGRLGLTTGKHILVDTGSRRVVSAPEVRAEICSHVAFSTDERLLAGPTGESYKYPQTVCVWEVASGKIIASLGNIRSSVCLAFLTDGRTLVIADHDHLRFWDFVDNRERACWKTGIGGLTIQDDYCFAHDLAVTADGKTAATGHDDGTILLWDLTRVKPMPTAPITPDEHEALWKDLAGEPAKAWRAILRLQSDPAVAVSLLKKRMSKIEPVSADAVAKLIGELGAAEFQKREAAQHRLVEVADQVGPELGKQLINNPPAETRKRIAQILETLSPLKPPPAPVLQGVRAVGVLKQIGTPEAKELLTELAQGAETARLTHAAKAALNP